MEDPGSRAAIHGRQAATRGEVRKVGVAREIDKMRGPLALAEHIFVSVDIPWRKEAHEIESNLQHGALSSYLSRTVV